MNTAEDSKVKHGSYCPVLQRNVPKAQPAPCGEDGSFQMVPILLEVRHFLL